jgi:hypothetical protein
VRRIGDGLEVADAGDAGQRFVNGDDLGARSEIDPSVNPRNPGASGP